MIKFKKGQMWIGTDPENKYRELLLQVSKIKRDGMVVFDILYYRNKTIHSYKHTEIFSDFLHKSKRHIHKDADVSKFLSLFRPFSDAERILYL